MSATVGGQEDEGPIANNPCPRACRISRRSKIHRAGFEAVCPCRLQEACDRVPAASRSRAKVFVRECLDGPGCGLIAKACLVVRTLMAEIRADHDQRALAIPEKIQNLGDLAG